MWLRGLASTMTMLVAAEGRRSDPADCSTGLARSWWNSPSCSSMTDASVGVQGRGSPPLGVEMVDLGGATLLPGLIDAHVAFNASPDPVGRFAMATDDEVLDGMRAAARRRLAAGITTVRDLVDRSYLGLRLRDGRAAYSDVARTSAVGSFGPAFLALPHLLSGRHYLWRVARSEDANSETW
jgi:hypothetical protein